MQCPGQDSRYWDGQAVFETKCSKCGQAIEFFKDDSSRKCKHCGHKMLNPRIDFGCASYCPYAEQCLGGLPPQLLAKKQEQLKDQVAVAMKKYFAGDFKRIGHATRVARYAERISSAIPENQEQPHPAVVLIAAYLHDIGIKEAERKYNSTSPRYQHQEGPPIARRILTDLGAETGLIDEVCDIIGHHHYPHPQETLNYKVVYDADLIVNLEEKMKAKGHPPDLKKISGSFLTDSGRRLASAVLQDSG
jgi:HD superfamily phosphohydrolase YqeK